MVATLTCQHRLPHVRGVTYTWARRTKPAEALNPLTPAQNQLGGVAHAALRRGCCEIQALRWMPKRLGITNNMWWESTTQFPAVPYPPIPATPGYLATPRSNPTKLHTWGWNMVPKILEVNSSYPDVSESLTTCPGSHPHLGAPYQAR